MNQMTAAPNAQAPAKRPQTLMSALCDERVIGEIQRALPSHMSADRMARVAITAATRTPKLQECDVRSVMRCLMDLSSLGLEPDGRLAHLIPFGKECQLIIDYKGLVDIAYRSGMVRSIHADVVYEGDIFVYQRGEVRDHVPWGFRRDDDKPDTKGDAIAAYCCIELIGGAHKHEAMPKDEIESIRERSRARNNGPWMTDWSEMAKKTVFRRASKWIPMSSEIRAHYDKDFDSLPAYQQQAQQAPSRVRASDLNRLVGDAAVESVPNEKEPDPDSIDLDSEVDGLFSREDLGEQAPEPDASVPAANAAERTWTSWFNKRGDRMKTFHGLIKGSPDMETTANIMASAAKHRDNEVLSQEEYAALERYASRQAE